MIITCVFYYGGVFDNGFRLWSFANTHSSVSFQPQSSLMDLMDVPEPGASADPWGAGAGAGAAAASADPWQPYGIHTLSSNGQIL